MTLFWNWRQLHGVLSLLLITIAAASDKNAQEGYEFTKLSTDALYHVEPKNGEGLLWSGAVFSRTKESRHGRMLDVDIGDCQQGCDYEGFHLVLDCRGNDGADLPDCDCDIFENRGGTKCNDCNTCGQVGFDCSNVNPDAECESKDFCGKNNCAPPPPPRTPAPVPDPTPPPVPDPTPPPSPEPSPRPVPDPTPAPQSPEPTLPTDPSPLPTPQSTTANDATSTPSFPPTSNLPTTTPSPTRIETATSRAQRKGHYTHHLTIMVLMAVLLCTIV